MNEQTIFIEALEYETEADRAAFLDKACSDCQQRSRIQRLLDAHQRCDDFPATSGDEARQQLLHELPDNNLLQSTSAEQSGQHIGKYKLLEQIGEGGMGVVYMADQQHPVKRRVALKVIKPGMDTRQIIGRFEAERQALAMMDHGNIAHVLDAGTTESGRPYFVMELVRGIPLTEYCQREQLDLEQRLNLFIDVCFAVQHAHLKGIIHRDIKPSNVMVTMHDGMPIVKMIDFGVAKAINQQLTDKTVFTNYSQMIGTPLYMSPEQAEMSGLDVDTRSDVYSLGVLLYELLTDTTPFEKDRLRQAGYDEMRRIIREEEPPRPSTRLSTAQSSLQTIRDKRSVSLKDMSKALKGDLDWIVVKAIEKNRARRYQSARELADDIKRYLQGEAVEARPPSYGYRAAKFLARHKALTISAALLTLLLILATAVSTIFAFRAIDAEQTAETAQQRAETEAAIAREISHFLSDELLGQASPYASPDRNLTLRQVLDLAADRVEGQFAERPLVEAQLRMTIGTTYQHLGEYSKALLHLTRASQLREATNGKDDPDRLRSEHETAIAELYQHGISVALPRWENTLRRQRAVLGNQHPDTLVTMGWLAYTCGLSLQFDRAEALFAEANKGFEAVLGPDHPETLDCLDGMAQMLNFQGHYDASEQLHRRILETRRRVLGEDHPQFLDSLSAMADICVVQGKHEEALEFHRQAMLARSRIEGDDHPDTLSESRDIGRALQATFQFEQAEDIYKQTLAREQSVLGADDQRTLWTMRRLASLHQTQGRFEQALSLYQTVLDSRRRTLGNEHEFTLSGMGRVAWTLLLLERFHEAVDLRTEVVTTTAKLFGEHDSRTVHATNKLIHALQEAGRLDEAQQLGEQLLQQQTTLRGRFDPETMAVMLQLAYTSKKNRKLKQSESLFEEICDIRTQRFGADDEMALRAANQLGNVLRFQGQLVRAEQITRETLKLREEKFGEVHTDVLESLIDLASNLNDQKQHVEAAQILDRAIRIRRTVSGDSHPLTVVDITRLSDTAALLEQAEDWPRAAVARENAWRYFSEVISPGCQQAITNLDMATRDLRNAEMADWKRIYSLCKTELQLRQTSEVQPRPIIVHCQYKMAVALFHLNRTDEAQQILETCLQCSDQVPGAKELKKSCRFWLKKIDSKTTSKSLPIQQPPITQMQQSDAEATPSTQPDTAQPDTAQPNTAQPNTDSDGPATQPM